MLFTPPGAHHPLGRPLCTRLKCREAVSRKYLRVARAQPVRSVRDERGDEGGVYGGGVYGGVCGGGGGGVRRLEKGAG